MWDPRPASGFVSIDAITALTWSCRRKPYDEEPIAEGSQHEKQPGQQQQQRRRRQEQQQQLQLRPPALTACAEGAETWVAE